MQICEGILAVASFGGVSPRCTGAMGKQKIKQYQ
jgi:hypothetical protein